MSLGKYYDKGEKPEGISYYGVHHVSFYVSNALQAAAWYVGRFGFQEYAFQGLESTKPNRDFARRVVRQGKIFLEFISQYEPKESEFTSEMAKHGDAVKDVAFKVNDCRKIYKRAIENGATTIAEPQVLSDDQGEVVVATVKTYGDCHHTFVEKKAYKGEFLPGYDLIEDGEEDAFYKITGPVGLSFVDHCVGNQPVDEMEPVVQWYEKVLKFHRFWSVDDSVVHTEYSALNSTVMTDYDEVVKMPINEPAVGKKKSQIQEYVDYHGGAGVQHIALNTPDILTAVDRLRKRGLKFLKVPKNYYDSLREKLKSSPISIKEDLNEIERLNILIDFDDKGYLLQIFTVPVEDRPTLFFEIIQRNNHQGFGAGNFKALFEAIEQAQDKRGNLVDQEQK